MDGAAIRSWLDDRTATGDFSGVVLVRRDGETILDHATGLASRAHAVPNTMSTRFAVASITKLPVAVTALRLAERGVLDLHRPLLDILPPQHRTAAMTREHTAHHLLSHSSGFSDYHDDDDPSSFTANWDRIPTYHVRRPTDLLPLFADLPARRAPGVAYEYVDANFVLAGLVLEAVTGRPWEHVVAEEVFGPAGMADTTVEALDGDPIGLAVGYLVDGGPVDRRRTNVFSVTAMGMPDGGMLSTASDLAALIEHLVDGRLLRPASFTAMTTPHATPVEGDERYGYGCLLELIDGRVAVIGHGGSDPGVSCLVAHHLAEHTTIVVLCNQDRGAWATTMEISRALGLRDPRGA